MPTKNTNAGWTDEDAKRGNSTMQVASLRFDAFNRASEDAAQRDQEDESMRRFKRAMFAIFTAVAVNAFCGAIAMAAQSAPSVDGAAIVTANQILNRWEPVAVAAGVHSTNWREQLVTQLTLMPSAWLTMFESLEPDQRIGARDNYARFTQMFVNAYANLRSKSDKQSGKLASATSDLVFVPIAPCRIVDTRNTSSPITAGTLAKYFFYGDSASFSFSLQGGIGGTAASACPGTVLASGGGSLGTVAPAAAAATITVANATAGGNFVVWGGGLPVPTTSVLNWSAGQALANTTVVPGGGRTAGDLDFAVYYNGPSGQADVVVDVVGYYVENTATALQCSTQLATGAGSATNGAAIAVAYPTCPSGYARTGGGCSTIAPLGANVYLQSDSNNNANCVFFNNSGSTIVGSSFRAEAVCCRLPGQ